MELKKFLIPDPLFPIFKINEQRNGYNGVRGEKEWKDILDLQLQNKIVKKYPDVFINHIISGTAPENLIRNVTNNLL